MLHEVPNDLQLSILRNQVIPRKFLKCLEVMASTQLATQKPNGQMLRVVLKTFYRKKYITLFGGRGWVGGWGLGVGAYGGYKIPKYRRLFSKNTALPEDFFSKYQYQIFLLHPQHLYYLQATPSCTSHREKADTSFEFTNKTFRLFQACYCLVGVIVVSCTRNIVSAEVRFPH